MHLKRCIDKPSDQTIKLNLIHLKVLQKVSKYKQIEGEKKKDRGHANQNTYIDSECNYNHRILIARFI